MLKLEFPNESHRVAYEKLIKDWDWMRAPSSFFETEKFDEFIEIANKDIIWVPWKVPAHFFLLINDEIKDEIIWTIQIRHHINHPNLIEDGWHIWYWIDAKYRRKWYWTKMLALALEKIKELWLPLDKVMITCDIDNIWSNKVIQNNGWVFEKIVRNWTKNRYWIIL